MHLLFSFFEKGHEKKLRVQNRAFVPKPVKLKALICPKSKGSGETGQINRFNLPEKQKKLKNRSN